MFRNLCSIIILAVASAASAVPGEVDVWDQVANFKGWKVSDVSIAGLDDTPLLNNTSKRIAKGLALSEDDAVLYEKLLREDVARIRLLLARSGFPYAGITPRVEAVEDKRAIKLTFEIDSGPAVIVRSIDWNQVPEGLERDLEQHSTIRPGDTFSDETLAENVELVVDKLKTIGHAYAAASAKLDWGDSTTVDVTIVAAPGPVYYFSGVVIQGVSDDLIGLAHILVDIKEGERYHPEIIRDARDYLSRSGVFRQIRITLEQTAADSLDVHVDLQKRKPRSIETAVGYWTDEQWSGRIKWQHRDFFHRARGISFELQLTQFRRWGKASAWWPAIFGRKRSMGSIAAALNNENEDSYEKTAPGIGLSYGYTFTRNTVATIGYTVERASYDIKTTEKEVFQNAQGLVGWVTGRVTRDGMDDRINPTKGTFSWIVVEWGPKGGVSESNWVSVLGSGTAQFPIKKTVFATNLRLGWGVPIEPAKVLLPDRRFYGGGATDHRGFHRRKLGPKDVNGVPLGGEVLLTGFFEYRFPMFWKFDGAAFFDFGQVWQKDEYLRLDTIELAAGPALRLMTPVGPLRLDWGIRITNHDDTEPRSTFHFAIGYPM